MNILKISRLNMLWFCLLAIACAEDKEIIRMKIKRSLR